MAMSEEDQDTVAELSLAIGAVLTTHNADPRLAITALESVILTAIGMIDCPGCRKLAYEILCKEFPKHVKEKFFECLAKDGNSNHKH